VELVVELVEDVELVELVVDQTLVSYPVSAPQNLVSPSASTGISLLHALLLASS
jgi:hypothetical protein